MLALPTLGAATAYDLLKEGKQILDAAGELHRIPRSEIDEIEVDPGSVMPTNFGELLTVTEFHDLVAFVLTLNGDAATAGETVDATLPGEVE